MSERSRASNAPVRSPSAAASRPRQRAPVARAQTKSGLDSRDALLRALAVVEELGAPLWAEKMHAELRRISGRRPGSDELSETEQRVAALVADGRSNREIAAELYISVRTVESHLAHVYRKLGVRSRAQLTRYLISAESGAKGADETAKVQ